MAVGVMLSACLFIPTLISLFSGGRGSIDWSILNNTFNGNIANIIQNFTIGSTSANGSVSLFCGSLALLGCIAFFMSSKNTQKKLKVGVILFVSVMIFYWQPLFALFSLLKSATSYWYRYSYLTIFLIIFIAADYFSTIELEQNAGQSLTKISITFSAVLLIISWVKPVWPIKYVYYTCAFTIGIAIFIAFYFHSYTVTKNIKQLATLLLAGSVIFELMGNAYILLRSYSKENVSEYSEYSVNQQEQIDQIKATDQDFYRISQTSTYNMHDDSLRTNYNEGYAYNYWSLTSYTSDPDDFQREFMDSLGYRINGENMYIVNSPILAVDSLLGVKYILSPYPVEGFIKDDDYGKYNGKNVYYNPYVLPFAFSYEDENTLVASKELNPFEYQNFLYSQLLGEEIELYFPIEFETRKDEDNQTYTYVLNCPEGNYMFYGNITWDTYLQATLNVNNVYTTGYSKWDSPSVFQIPINNSQESTLVCLTYENDVEANAQFYAFDLDAFQTVISVLKEREAEQITVNNTSAHFEISAQANEDLLISIPNNEGWEFTLNGEQIEVKSFADCLISVPLEEGNNVIEMEYHVPGLNIGLMITGLTIAGAVIIFIIKKIRHIN